MIKVNEKVKEKVIGVIEKQNKNINSWNESISRIKETPMYTEEHKKEQIAGYKEQILIHKDSASKEIIKLFDEEIERVSNENKYKDNNPEKTANILKMLEMTKDTITEAEINHLINIYGDNNIINRVVLGVAESRNIHVDSVKYYPDTIELEELKNNLVGAIRSSREDSIESLKLELLLQNM